MCVVYVVCMVCVICGVCGVSQIAWKRSFNVSRNVGLTFTCERFFWRYFDRLFNVDLRLYLCTGPYTMARRSILRHCYAATHLPVRCALQAGYCQRCPDRVNLERFGRRAFACAEPTLWNKLPRNIRDNSNITQFKKQLKTLLFST